MESTNPQNHIISEEERSNILYILPTDDDESSRLLKQHLVLKYMEKTNYHVPLEQKLNEGIKVLDSGCGPGCWSIEMAKDYPNSQFYGVDMTPHDFSNKENPVNFEFTVGNITEKIPFPDNTFDFVYQRLVHLGLNSQDWDNALNELYRVLKPGGYIELIEPDIRDIVNIGPLMEKFRARFIGVLEQKGIRPSAGAELKDRLNNAGFINEVEKKVRFNLNHTDVIGELLWQDYKAAILRIQPLIALDDPKLLEPKAFEEKIDECGQQAKDNKTLTTWYFTYAQKPE